jgi:hypothetical protein
MSCGTQTILPQAPRVKFSRHSLHISILIFTLLFSERINKLEELLTTQLVHLVSALRGDPYDVRYAHNPVRSPLFSPLATVSASLAHDTAGTGVRDKISPSPGRLMNPSPMNPSPLGVHSGRGGASIVPRSDGPVRRAHVCMEMGWAYVLVSEQACGFPGSDCQASLSMLAHTHSAIHTHTSCNSAHIILVNASILRAFQLIRQA